MGTIFGFLSTDKEFHISDDSFTPLCCISGWIILSHHSSAADLSLCAPDIGRVGLYSSACDNKSLHPVGLVDCQSEPGPQLGLNDRGLLVRHDVPVGRSQRRQLPGNVLLVCTQRMLSLHVRVLWWTDSTGACVRKRVRKKHTYIIHSSAMHAPDASKSAAAFRTVTVFNIIIPLRVINRARTRTHPCSMTAGLAFVLRP